MTAPRFFTLDYVERAVLSDGRRVIVRLVRPEDKEILRDGFDRLSPASRYARFLSPKQALSDDELRYLVDIDHEHHLAIGVGLDDTDPSPGAPDAVVVPPVSVGLAIARFIRLTDRPNTAEAAIAVADDAQHQGLGKLLFLRLVAAAAERGIERFRCEVLGSNASMAALLAQISPERSIEVGSGLMSIEIALPNVTPTQPLAEPMQHGMYRLFRAVAENAAEWTGVIRGLWRR